MKYNCISLIIIIYNVELYYHNNNYKISNFSNCYFFNFIYFLSSNVIQILSSINSNSFKLNRILLFFEKIAI